MITKIIKKIQKILQIDKILKNQNEIKIALGLQNFANRNNIKKNINDFEFKIFSQYGDDGIINYIISNINLYNKKFIEFGVENYEESNTRFLLEGCSWSGLILDSSIININYIKSQSYYWKYDLKVENKLVTKKNINQILLSSDFTGKIGLLSIDIDGNDYWIWNEIKVIDPSIVIIEYNARLGDRESKTIPYEENFNRNKSNNSNIYYGASLMALYKLGKKRGYSLVATNSNGNNAYFIKNKLIPRDNKFLKPKKPHECYNINTFKELRDNKNSLLFLSHKEEFQILKKKKYVQI